MLIIFLLALGSPALLRADRVSIASDDAGQSAYNSNWDIEGGGTGFGNWTFRNLEKSDAQSHAGFYAGNTHDNPDLKPIAVNERAFGMFANGTQFENATAYRAFTKPLETGASFSFMMLHGEFVKRGDYDDPGGSSAGLILRTGNLSTSVEDYNKGSRFEFGAYKDKLNYQIYDGEPNSDTGIPLTNGGLKITVKLLTPDTYDLEVTTLKDNQTTRLNGRKFGGTAGGTIDSFCVFDRNGEKFDVFFNSFQVFKE
jgi:hypothetical protein